MFAKNGVGEVLGLQQKGSKAKLYPVKQTRKPGKPSKQ